MLQARMQRHGEEMMYLAAMVLTINYEGAAHIAQHIAEEPRIGRPTPDDQGTISELLPGRFFDLQDELNVRAKAVAEAARTQAKDKLVEAYGRLTETCVNCHAVYLQKDPEGLGESGAFDAYPDGPDAEPIERE